MTLDKWQEYEFLEVYKRLSLKKYQLPKRDYSESGKHPIVDQGKSKAVAYSDCDTPITKELPFIVFGDHTREIKWIDFPCFLGADGTQPLTTHKCCLEKYGYYLLEATPLGSLGYSRHFSLLKEKQFLLPPLPEQHKIAEILGACDEAIEAQERLIAQKKQRKKGLMQKLLTGEVRFPEFEETPWKEVRLGDVGKPYSGLTGKNKSDFGHGRPYISYMNVFSSSRIRTDILERVSVGPDEKQHAVQQGDFFFTISSETPNEVGMASVLLHKIEDTYLNSFCFGFRPHPCSPITPEYAQFCLRGQEFRRAIRRLAQGATRYNLSKGSLMLLSLKIPERDEQSAISSVLSACDEEIALQQSKLEQLKQQKKGLMQQLLTGKVRVKV